MSTRTQHDDDAFAPVLERLEEHVTQDYGLAVTYEAFEGSFKGDFDGTEIFIDEREGTASKVFMLTHLFGHTVQMHRGVPIPEVTLDNIGHIGPELQDEVVEYEIEACRYGLRLLHDVGAAHLGQWYSDYAHTDRRYLLDFYTTGERTDFWSFWQDGSEPLTPKPIPAFEVARKRRRGEGVVV